MATVVQTVDLSLTDFLVPPVVHIKQYDTAARKIVCNLYIESTQFSVPSGYVADIAAIKPDGETFQYNSKSNADVIQISNGAVEITITEAMSAVPGIIPVDVTLADASGLAGCFAFVLDVQKTAARSEITASDVADDEDNEDDSEITTSAKIYGVSWDKSSSTKLIRTDDAAGFTDPVPAIGGTGGSSPFDYILPWAGIQKIEDAAAGTMVVIPKFYYRWVDSTDALTLQISSESVSGFSVSPAHMTRGDGAGERDVVYLARYKCAGTDGISVSGEAPTATLTRAVFRENAAALGTGYSQQDFAMFWTLRMLFLVEYASWDGQGSIGCGCGDGSAAAETGTTDGMAYHTGTMQESLDAYGQGVQYRWIEDPWGGLLEWVDGCYFDGDHNLFLIPNPADFSDDTGGTEVGALNLYGYVTEWYIPTADGFEWALLPAAVGGSAESYIPDSCGLFSGPCMAVGGQYKQQSTVAGPFRIYATSVSAAYATIGARLQKLPQ